jgi:hypothetical protein
MKTRCLNRWTTGPNHRKDDFVRAQNLLPSIRTGDGAAIVGLFSFENGGVATIR